MSLEKWRPLPDGMHRAWVLMCPMCREFCVDGDTKTVTFCMAKETALAAQASVDCCGIRCARCQSGLRYEYVKWALLPAKELV